MSAQARLQARRPAGPARAVGFDVGLLGIVTVLLALGALMVVSTTIADAERAVFGPALRHLSHVAVGAAAMLLVSRLPVSCWQVADRPLLLLGLGLLVVLVLPGFGVTHNGSTRWFSIAGFSLQPAEPAKLFMVIHAAGYLTRKRDYLGNFTQGILMIGLVLAVLGMLLLRQPDLGSFVVIMMTVAAMLFLAGVRFWHFLLCALVSAGALGMLIWSSAYRMDRVTSFLDPWKDPSDSSYQLVQGLIALGRGEWLGVGLGASVQKLYFLPHAENDFLLAVIGEELGFAGVCAVIILFGMLLWRAFAISRAAERTGQLYAARLAQGLGLLLVLQAMIHVGVNLGSLPTKGLTLPFMSYGGSSLITSCVAVGILLSIERALWPAPGRRP